MKKLLELITEEFEKAFEQNEYDKKLGKVVVSNRPDLCQYQCNGAMAGAKLYHKAPIMIANQVVESLQDNEMFESVEAVMPGFINIKLNSEFVAKYLNDMKEADKYGCENKAPETIVIDYGGANVAKPLHVGHLRSAVIGESVKRIERFMGNKVISDVHLGDWGLQMGLIITELHERKPELVYFDAAYEGEYPEEAPFTISELEEIYPTASGKSKEDAAYKEAAMQATFELQKGRRGYIALWKLILSVSIADLKKNYDSLNVSFDLWKGESDADSYIAPMAEQMKKDGFAYMSEGALVVDVSEETDAKEIPPCMILKSDGASLYTTTDLATIVWRMKDYHPDQMVYLADKRQELHFVQVFRCAKKTGLVDDNTELKFIGFGTMNGKDGKPFKTREGGVMRLEKLVGDIQNEMYQKIAENNTMEKEEAEKTAKQVALSAIKYGDLSNQASKDYIFDIDRFISFEGNTGPHIQYMIVRIKSILEKYKELRGADAKVVPIRPAESETEKALQMALCRFGEVTESAFYETAPHKLCQYMAAVADAFNAFYLENKILSEEDAAKQAAFISLITLTKRVLDTCMDLLGMESPEHM